MARSQNPERSHDRNVRRIGSGSHPQLAHPEAASKIDLTSELRKSAEDPRAVAAQDDLAENCGRDDA